MTPRASALVALLSLKPHPEGGYYREVFRSKRHVTAEANFGQRSAITTIYFLILGEEPSRWHRVLSDEVWHFLEGSPAEIFTVDPIRLEMEATHPGSAQTGRATCGRGSGGALADGTHARGLHAGGVHGGAGIRLL